MKPLHFVFILAALGVSGCGSKSGRPPLPIPADGDGPSKTSEHDHTSWTLEQLARDAVLLPGLESVRRPVNTRSSEAQAFFDQGLALTYGFNHDEAARSFARAAELDPQCAMCSWGVAYTLGPNYNMPMLPERAALAWDALTRARALVASGEPSPVEKALVEALAMRYAGPEYVDPQAMQAYNVAYSEAMRDVASQFPDDLDVQVLFAESVMDVNPWKLWTLEGEPGPGTLEIVGVLESVLARAPDHVGANHYYIHVVEASEQPQRAEAAADRLGNLLPGAGHTVHMPAHIYQRVGRYADASAANRRAIEADERYLATVTPPGYYPFYLGHNYGFLAYSAAMQGRSAEAIEASRHAAASIPTGLVCGMPGMDFFLTEPLLVLVRFGRWQKLLAEPQPDAKYPVLSALWHHAHGLALASTGDVAGARADLQAIERIAAEVPEDLITGLNSGHAVLALAAKILEAKIVEVEDRAASIPLWEQAVALEDRLAYNEPADWFYPVRHQLGAVLLDEGRARAAEAVYRADLERHPANGWALYGLWKALQAQKKAKAAKAAEASFREAWKDADIELTRTAF
jgi:tetratricopeptide (TPR) repeat protein